MDRAKYDLCRQFVKLLREEELTQRQLATQLGTSEARVSEIVHYRIDKLTVEQLIRYWEKVRPNFKLKLG
jgi:predicted XRE-type DNA-binding protein